jgi:hypothetical protein
MKRPKAARLFQTETPAHSAACAKVFAVLRKNAAQIKN